MGARGRLRQGMAGLVPTPPPDLPIELGRVLSPAMIAALRGLPAFDQRHLISVAEALHSAGCDDPDLLRAALLHDIGKAAGGGRVRLTDRAAFVLLSAVSTRLTARLASLPAPRWRRGIALAHHHPALGAEWAAELGCSARACWLIRHHADRPLPDDAELRLLAAADARVEAS